MAQDNFKRFLPYWLAASITALVSVAYTKIFALSESLAFRWADANAWWALAVIPIGMLASFYLARFASPEAGGSGIPQVIAAAEIGTEDSSFLQKLLGIRMILVKIFSSCVCVAAGGVIGREGPTLQIASGVFYQVQKLWPKKLPIPNLQTMILAGGAAGLSAAFNTPLGGIVFVIEELSKAHISKVRTGVFHSVIFAGLLSQAFLGDYLYLGKISVTAVSFGAVAKISAFAVVVGIIASAMGKAVLVISDLRARSSLAKNSVLTVASGLVVAALFLGFGRENIGSGRELIHKLLSHPDEIATLSQAFARTFGSFFTYIGGVVGGVFAPALASGAAFGSWFSQFNPAMDPKILILAGMVAFLTGLTRTPFTSFILVLEMTDSHASIVALMAAAISAYGSSQLVDKESFYEQSSKRILSRFKP